MAFSQVLCHSCGAGFAVSPDLIISWGSGGLQTEDVMGMWMLKGSYAGHLHESLCAGAPSIC